MREDKTCLNCGNVVDDRYCPHCGQENVATHQSFGALLAHFIEDFTHYEGKFWQTMKYLLFRPAYLTREYLAGKRMSYLPPVRLYIFMSFVTFFLPHVLPDFSEHKAEYTPQQEAMLDSLRNDSSSHVAFNHELGLVFITHYQTVAQLDSARLAGRGTPGEISRASYWATRKAIELKRYSPRDLEEKFMETLGKSIPKALFIYMPLFALVLWLFHGKRKWLYFDHAIFTLHYFSFLLIVVCFLTLLFTFSDWLVSGGIAGAKFMGLLNTVANVLLLGAMIYYFYHSHKKLYGETQAVSFVKSSAILLINTLFFGVIMVFTMIISVVMIH